jgi:hypothetical protein
MRRRRLLWVLALAVALGAAAWHWQSVLIGRSASWWLTRVAAREEATGDLSRRRTVVTSIHRQLLMPPPADSLVPELFDFVTALSSRVASGEISFPWAAYVYTSYQRDVVRDRPAGRPRRTPAAIAARVDEYVRFYALRKRPEVEGVRVPGLLGVDGDDVITLEEIEQAERDGRTIDLRTRGAR